MLNAINFTENIQRKLQTNSRITIIAIIACCVISLGSCFLAFQYATAVSEQVYVLSENGAIESSRRQDRSTTLTNEIYDQVQKFHDLLFNLSPDSELINNSKQRVIELGDRSILEFWNRRDEENFYTRMIDSDASEEIQMTEIQLDTDSYPYRATYYGNIYILRAETVTKYEFVSTCRILMSNRTTGNLHGLTIEDFHVEKMDKIETRKRKKS